MTDFTLPSPKGRVVTVLGGGVLGRRIACGWAAGGYDVVIRDPSSEQRNAALHYCETNMSQFSESEPRGQVRAEEDLKPAVSKSWLVIEAVPEKLSLKISTFAELEGYAPTDAILCSNSSSYKSSEMLGDLKLETKQRVLNMHYYMPPGNRIVELMTDGYTHSNIFPFLVKKLTEVGFHPFVARKESTGLIFNRLWAAIKREVLNILAEDVSTPEEIDSLWKEMWFNNPSGPVAMMDAVGLDTVSFIEQHYIAERNLPDTPVKFLRKYLDQGKLGSKSSKGGLLPPGFTTKVGEAIGGHDNVHAPLLYFLDIGLAAKDPKQVFKAGRILVGSPDQRKLKVLISDQILPDGIDISLSAGKIFWTSMGIPSESDGAVLSANLDGSEVTEIVPRGQVHTPKQLCVDADNSKLYFSDREGLRVMRCNFDGSQLETIVRSANWQDASDQADETNWCVGIAVSPTTGKFYWTQKGPSKGNKGRIFRANIDFLPGQNAESRSDIELLFQNLPEPVDLDIDPTDETLYWTDRGELPLGNSINRANAHKIQPLQGHGTSLPGKDYEIIVRNLHEAIGVKVDAKNRHIYATDLGGLVYRFNMDGGDKKKFYEDGGAFTGLSLAYV